MIFPGRRSEESAPEEGEEEEEDEGEDAVVDVTSDSLFGSTSPFDDGPSADANTPLTEEEEETT